MFIDVSEQNEENEEKINLTPIVDTILSAVESTVVTSVENSIEEAVQNAFHVNHQGENSTGVHVDVPLELNEDEASTITSQSEESVKSSDEAEQISTETEVDAETTTSKQRKPTSKKK
jgi:biopolymer transport protein ExbD